VSQFRSYGSDNKYAAVLCCTTSTEAGALKPLAVSGSVPTVIVTAAAAGLPQPPNFVRISYDTTAPGGLFEQSINFAAKQWKPKTAVLEVTNDSAFNANPTLLALFKDALAKKKIKLLATINTSVKDTDFSGAASTTVDKKPDLVIFDLQADRTPLMARALQQAGYKGKLLGNYSMTSPTLAEQAGSAFNGLTMAAVFSPLFSNKQAKTFLSGWNKRWASEPPDVFATNAYIAVKFVAQAIKTAGITGDRKKIATAMAKIKSLDTPEGKLTMKNGDAFFTGSPTYLQWKNGKLVVVASGG
jgi:ABC-type branched-subunit amino acid transport system substrate-binding protein